MACVWLTVYKGLWIKRSSLPGRNMRFRQKRKRDDAREAMAEFEEVGIEDCVWIALDKRSKA